MKKKNTVNYIIAVLLCLIMFVPFIWGFILSFKDNFSIFLDPAGLPKKFDFSLYIDTFRTAHLLNLFKNSLIVTTIPVAVGMALLYISSFSIARLTHKGSGISNFFYFLFLAATSVPSFVLLMTIFNITLGIGKIDTLEGIMLPYIAAQIPFSTLMYVGGMKGIPVEMEEAGIIDGCGLFSIMFKIDLPIMMPVVVTLFIFTFLGIWNEFPVSSILLNSNEKFTIPLAMSFFKDQHSSDYGAMLRGVVMILIPQMIFYFIFQKRIIEGMAATGIKG